MHRIQYTSAGEVGELKEAMGTEVNANGILSQDYYMSTGHSLLQNSFPNQPIRTTVIW